MQLMFRHMGSLLPEHFSLKGVLQSRLGNSRIHSAIFNRESRHPCPRACSSTLRNSASTLA